MQLASNVYLKPAKKGGDILLWDIKPSADEYAMMKKSDSYGIERHKTGDPDVIIRPDLGDLIIFNPEYVHAVDRVEEGRRVTWSSFIGVKDENQPLFVWS